MISLGQSLHQAEQETLSPKQLEQLQEETLPLYGKTLILRKLTPKEKEKLQGFPKKDLTNEAKGYTIEICTEKSLRDFIINANAAIRNLRYPLIAGNADKQKQLGLQKIVLFAENNLYPYNHKIGKPVLPDVLINCGEYTVEIHSQKRLCGFVNSAVSKSSFPLLVPLENFVHLFASINTIGEAIIHNGEAELPLNELNLIHHWSGKELEEKSGKEIMQLAKDVVLNIPTIDQLTKYTISNLSSISKKGCALITLFLSALNAIDGYIPEEILEKNILRVQINGKYGWTYIYGDNSDARRGIVIGNAVTVNVAEWIGRRINDLQNNRSK
jgi:hypothetical protein